MNETDTLLISKFESFLSELKTSLDDETSAASDFLKSVDVRQKIDIYANEAIATLGMVLPYLPDDRKGRLLEVGSGLGFVSIFLKKQGFNIVALEPSSNGFDFFSRIQNDLMQLYQDTGLELASKTAEALDPEVDGNFSLIFSHNVVEHIPEPETALAAMRGVLEPGGVMIHCCPNYTIPFEPHLRIPVFGFWPRLTEILFAKKVQQKLELWQSLNFISHRQVIRFCRKSGLQVVFKKGQLFDAFRRLETDEIFRARHPGFVLGAISMILNKTRLVYLLRYLPAAISTPMTFELRFNDGESRG